MNVSVVTWSVAALATAGVVAHPWRLPEAVWPLGGAVLLIGLGLLSWQDALAGAANGLDVYLFLAGMMVLAELARQEGLFDWLAAKAARAARGSAPRLFMLIFGVGTVVTIFLSNDATAVVLTPAVAAVVRAVEAKHPLPYLLVCAFVANAASFVLPISNPANLVIYGAHIPPLLQWLPLYALPSVLSVGATYTLLRFTQRRHLAQPLRRDLEIPALPAGGLLTALGIILTSIALLTASALGLQLGLPTFLAGMATALVVLWRSQHRPLETLGNIYWGVLPLVAGLFMLVEALRTTGATAELGVVLQHLMQRSVMLAAWSSGVVLAFACNLVNNLPAGLVAGRVVEAANAPEHVRAAVLVGVDLGPNLSVTGSLATLLWLSALRRDGHRVGAWTFLKLGAVVMPPALLLALCGAFVVR